MFAVPIASGGTGATTAADARSNLGLGAQPALANDAAFISAALADNTGGTPSNTIVTATILAVLLGVYNNNNASLLRQINNLRTDVDNLRTTVNSLLARLRTYGALLP